MKVFNGKVISIKMKKTATVSVERVVVHPMYKKRYRRNKKYHVHDDMGVKVGQMVKFVASKPYSKSKRWKIIDVIDENNKSKASKKGESRKSTLSKTRKSPNKFPKTERKKVSKKK